jgi:hypothetical protein
LKENLEEQITEAYALLLLDGAHALGLLEHSLKVKTSFCLEVLREGERKKMRPQKQAVTKKLLSVLGSDEEGLTQRFAEKLWEQRQIIVQYGFLS